MAAPSTASIGVLVIDDDPGTVELLRPALERDGFEVGSAGSAGAGYRLYLNWAFAVVMVKAAPLALDGLRLARLIRLLDRKTTVILISGVADLLTAVSALRAGADDYLFKPFKLGDLKDRIDGSRRRRAVVARQARPESVTPKGKSAWRGGLDGLEQGLCDHLERLRSVVERDVVQRPGFFEEVGIQALAAAGTLLVRESDRRLLGQAAELLFLCFAGEDPVLVQEAFRGPDELRNAWPGFALAGAEIIASLADPLARVSEVVRVTADLTERRFPEDAIGSPHSAGRLLRGAVLGALTNGRKQNTPSDPLNDQESLPEDPWLASDFLDRTFG